MYHTPFQTNYTALTESGADWVVKHGIKFVGIDYLSIATYEQLAPAHQSLMRVVMLLLHHGLRVCAVVSHVVSLANTRVRYIDISMHLYCRHMWPSTSSVSLVLLFLSIAILHAKL